MPPTSQFLSKLEFPLINSLTKTSLLLKPTYDRKKRTLVSRNQESHRNVRYTTPGWHAKCHSRLEGNGPRRKQRQPTPNRLKMSTRLFLLNICNWCPNRRLLGNMSHKRSHPRHHLNIYDTRGLHHGSHQAFQHAGDAQLEGSHKDPARQQYHGVPESRILVALYEHHTDHDAQVHP